MANLIGQTLLGQYRVDEFIASGGMGAVYKVWDLKRNVPLAMKTLHTDFLDDPSSFKYFQREARALQKLRHPNIVPFYGLYQEGSVAFLLEHYIDGPSLREILQNRKGGLPIPEALAYMHALCAALGYAHSNGVVHCDIKPGNVMVDSGGQIYLADFGIARHAESTTTTLAGAGTPAYMAPEQITSKAVVPATDIYSLGALLFEMLTGQRPFRGDEAELQEKGDTSGERVRYAHLHLPPPDPRKINPSIPPRLAEIVLKCLSKKPQDRYPFTGELLAALAALKIQVPPRVPIPAQTKTPGSPPTQAPRPASTTPQKTEKNLAPVLLAALVACGTIGAALFAFLIFRAQIPSIPVAIERVITEEPYQQPTKYVSADTAAPPTEAPPNSFSTFTPEPPPTLIDVGSTSDYDLAFVSDRDNPFGYLRPFIVDSQDTSNYQVLENPSGYERTHWPSFCGEQLAVETYDVVGGKPNWIYLYDKNGNPRAWNQSAESLGVPRCSPNGKYMAYSVQSNGWRFFVADVHSGQVLYRPDVSNYGKIPGYASWLDSSSFLFEIISPDETYALVENFPKNPSLTEVRKIKNKGVHAAISPDGSKAAFSCDEGKLCLYNFGNNSLQTLLQTRYDIKVLDWTERVTPVWSSDGRWIYYASVDGGDWDIFRVRPDGSERQNITANWDSNELMPATR